MKKNLRQLFGKIIVCHLKCFAKISIFFNKPNIIGVAGSVGKSSTCSAIEAVLKKERRFLHIHTNSETGVPLGILGLEKGNYSTKFWLKVILIAPFRIFYLKKFEVVLIEMGIDGPYPPKNMSYLLSIVKPKISVITHESATHTEQFSEILTKEQQEFSAEKKEKILIEALTKEDFLLLKNPNCQYAVININNQYIKNEFKKNKFKQTKIFLTGDDKNNQIILFDYEITDNKTIFTYKINLVNQKKQKINLELENYLLPQEYKNVFAQAIVVGLIFEIPFKKIVKNIQENFKIPKGRSSLFIGNESQIIVDSSYNASKEAIFSLLKLTRNLAEQKKLSITIILADMLELGPLAENEHLEVGKATLKVADSLLLVGNLTKKYILPMQENNPNKIKHFENLKSLRAHLKTIPKKSIILFKGSQGELWLEEALKVLIKKEDYKKLCRQNEFWMNVKKKKGLWF
jgi:UDP-N-acetylmuramyl pentapeptide synthase